jgi:hypothetical protein
MTKIRLISPLTLLVPSLVLIGCGPHGPRRPSPEDLIGADPLPLALGATWTYNATVSRFDPEADGGKGADVKKQLTWVTTVVEAHPIQNVVSFKIKGWPRDLVGDFQGAAVPVATERTMLRQGDTFMWSATPEGSADGAKGWFTWPLMDGQELCQDPQVSYCWQVATSDLGYLLTYHTGPDEESYLIQPGTGVSEYHYIHHGTTLEVHATLTEYKEGKAGAMTMPAVAN